MRRFILLVKKNNKMRAEVEEELQRAMKSFSVADALLMISILKNC